MESQNHLMVLHLPCPVYYSVTRGSTPVQLIAQEEELDLIVLVLALLVRNKSVSNTQLIIIMCHKNKHEATRSSNECTLYLNQHCLYYSQAIANKLNVCI